MKKLLIAAAAVALLLLAIGLLVALQYRSQDPEVLLDRLARGKGDRGDLIMRLNVARGDSVGPMIRALQDNTYSTDVRADILELLFKRNLRASEQRIEDAILAATRDPEPVIRRRAAYCLAVYAEGDLQATLADHIRDPDPQVRRQAYLVMGSRSRRGPERGVWQRLSAEQKERMIKDCIKQMKTEETPEMKRLARAVIGREIAIRTDEATQALQTSDLGRAEELLRGALKLDPQNCLAQIRLVRFHLKSGDTEKAIALAREYGGLIEVPTLSKAPVIDGDPNDPVWAEAFMRDQFYMTTSVWVQQPTKGKSKAFIGHRDGKLYIAVIGYEKDLSRLVKKHAGRDSKVWADDCVEILFDPTNSERDFYQFAVNANGGLYDAFRNDKSKNFKCEYGAGIFRDSGYWACEFAIDGKDLDNHLIKRGEVWSLNVYRVRIGPASEHCAVWPVLGGTRTLNNYPIAIFK